MSNNVFYSSTSDSQIPWTTARCNRLLRPISSRLAQLRKTIENERALRATAVALGSKVAEQENVVPAVGPGDQQMRRELSKLKKDDDPDWIPGQKPKRPVQRYTARRDRNTGRENAASSKSVCTADQIGLPTPFIARTLREVQDSPHVASPQQLAQIRTRGRIPKHLKPASHLDGLQTSLSSEAYTHFKGVFDGFSNALDATAKNAPKGDRLGARSLMSTCLRQIPAYIELEEEWQAEADKEEGSVDVSNSIYTELESLGVVEGQGWRPLSEVVRAHAIKLVRDAISDGTLSGQMSHRLISHCMDKRAWDAAQDLTTCSMQLQKPLSLPTRTTDDMRDHHARPILKTLHLLCENSRAWGYQYRELNKLMSRCALPVEWFATVPARYMLEKMIRVIASHDERHLADAVGLLETIFLSGCGVHLQRLQFGHEQPSKCPTQQEPSEGIETALTATIRSLCVGLALLADRSDTSSPATRKSALMILESLQRSFKSRSYSLFDQTNANRIRAGNLVMARLLSEITSPQLVSEYNISTNFNQTASLLVSINDHNVGSGKALIRQTALMLCTFSRCSGELDSAEFDRLKELVNQLMKPKAILDERSAWLLRQIAMHTANEFAASDSDHIDLDSYIDFAQSIQEEVSIDKPQDLPVKPSRRARPSKEVEESGTEGMRWEDSICEWVYCTPAPSKARQSNRGRYLPARQLNPSNVPSPGLPTPHPTSSPERLNAQIELTPSKSRSRESDSPQDSDDMSVDSSSPSSASTTPPPIRAETKAYVEIPVPARRWHKRARAAENDDFEPAEGNANPRLKRTRVSLPPYQDDSEDGSYSEEESGSDYEDDFPSAPQLQQPRRKPGRPKKPTNASILSSSQQRDKRYDNAKDDLLFSPGWYKSIVRQRQKQQTRSISRTMSTESLGRSAPFDGGKGKRKGLMCVNRSSSRLSIGSRTANEEAKDSGDELSFV